MKAKAGLHFIVQNRPLLNEITAEWKFPRKDGTWRKHFPIHGKKKKKKESRGTLVAWELSYLLNFVHVHSLCRKVIIYWGKRKSLKSFVCHCWKCKTCQCTLAGCGAAVCDQDRKGQCQGLIELLSSRWIMGIKVHWSIKLSFRWCY